MREDLPMTKIEFQHHNNQIKILIHTGAKFRFIIRINHSLKILVDRSFKVLKVELE